MEDHITNWTNGKWNALRQEVVTAFRVLQHIIQPGVVVCMSSRLTPTLRSDLNDQQKKFSDRVVNGVLTGQPVYNLLSGGAGAGKTHVTGNIEHRLSDMGFKSRAVCFQWRCAPS